MATAAIGKTKYEFTRDDNQTSCLAETPRGRQVRFVFTNAIKQVQAFSVGEEGEQQARIQLPRTFKQIQSSRSFKELLLRNNIRLGADFSSLELEPLPEEGESSQALENSTQSGSASSSGRSSPSPEIESSDEGSSFAREIRRCIQEGLAQIQSVRENQILFIGPTRVGKSLLVNLLGGCPLRGIRSNGQLCFEAENPLVQVSHSNESCTTIPGIFSPNGQNFSYVDCGGFDDTVEDGGIQDIANAFFRAGVAQKAKNLKIVLVVDYSILKSNANHMKKTLQGLMQLLDQDSAAGAGPLANSISLVFNKVPYVDRERIQQELTRKEEELSYDLLDNDRIENLEAEIADLKEQLRSPPPEELVQEILLSCIKGKAFPLKQKEFLRSIYENGRWVIFRAPTQIGQNPFVASEREKILSLICERTPYIPREIAGVRVQVSQEYQGTIQNAFLETLENLKKDFAPKFLGFLEKFAKSSLGMSSTKQEVQELQKRLTQFSKRIDTTLTELMAFINSDLKISELDPQLANEVIQFEEDLKFYAELLPAHPSYSLKRNWIKALDIESPMKVWDQQFDRILAKPETLWENGVLTVRGYFITTTEVKKALIGRSQFKKIRLFSPLAVTFDKDLQEESLRGVDLVSIAPTFHVVGPTDIHLTGTPGKSVSGIAADGSSATGEEPSGIGRGGGSAANGNPGEDGKNGGHFFALNRTIDNPQQLKVVTNGGKGGDGQYGGRGGSGSSGKSALLPRNFNDHDALGPVSRPGKKTIDREVFKYGKPGGRGGDGGRGGAAGRGGAPGSQELICLSDSTTSLHPQSSSIPGNAGQDGEGGRGGQGGDNGQNASGTWHIEWGYNIFYPSLMKEGWNGHAHCQPQLRGPNGRAEDGRTPQEKNDGGRRPMPPKLSLNVPSEITSYKQYLQNEKTKNPLMGDFIDGFCKEIDDSEELKKKHPQRPSLMRHSILTRLLHQL